MLFFLGFLRNRRYRPLNYFLNFFAVHQTKHPISTQENSIKRVRLILGHSH
jgi:hypothetical protein